MIMRIEGAMAQLRTSLVGAVLLAVAGIGAVRGGEDPGSNPDPGLSPLPVKTLVCGPNVLYMLLKLQGRPVTYQQVVQALGSDDKMTSLLELREAAARLGLPNRIRRCTLEELGRGILPCIAHTRSEYMRRSPQGGHYLLVLKVDGEMIQVVDGTTGYVFRTTGPKLAEIWTGYVLEPRAVQQAWTEVITLNGVGLLAVLGVVLLASHRRSPAGAPKFAAGLLLIACWSASGATPVAASEPSPGARDELGEWRTAANDAVNCLYLQLVLAGHPVEYARVREAVFAQGGAVNMVALREAAGHCGLPMKLVRCGPDELRRLPEPAIVYVHGTRTRGGFALLCNLDDERCDLIAGATACIREVEIDRFRRDWSGFALVREPPGDGWLSAIAGSLGLIAGYSGWRIRAGAEPRPRRLPLPPDRAAPGGDPDRLGSD
jgi:hypothetical protein